MSAAFFKTMDFLGLNSPWARLIFGGALGFAGQMIIKPSVSYDKSGSSKDFYFFSSGKNSTLLPWWIWPISGALLFSLFI